MGQFDTYNDSPNAIKNEGQEISLKFEKTSPTSGRISWNIPTPPQGCAAENQAYNGIIITLDTSHTITKKSPTNGIIYESDLTANKDLHTGDSIDSSIVIGSFYNDKTTTYLDINDLIENESYYISGYAVDKQNRYHTQGVHAYSLNQKSSEKSDDTNGCQSIKISNTNINPIDSTGLLLTLPYSFDIAYNIENLSELKDQNGQLSTYNYLPSNSYKSKLSYTEIEVNGSDSQTFQELIDSINLQFKKLDNPFINANPPNTNGLFWNSSEKILYKWDGYQHIEQSILYENIDPTTRTIGDLWFNNINLNEWDGSQWNTKPFISYHKDIALLDCNDYWFNGTNVYQWDGNVWISTTQYIQNTDPSINPGLSCGSFWFNETDSLLYKLNSSNDWIQINAIYWDTDPNALLVNTLWFNDLEEKLYQWNGLSFDELSIIVSNTQPSAPILNQYWFDLTSSELKQYDSFQWNTVSVLIHNNDPTIQESEDIFWNSTSDQLYSWNIITSSWDLVNTFIQSNINPLDDIIIPINSIWINGNSGYSWDGTQWNSINLIIWNTDPTVIVSNQVWFDSTNSLWFLWDGTQWISTEIIESENDPSSLPLDTLWFNSSNDELKIWNGLQWISISYSINPLTPNNKTLWLNNNTNELFEWYKNKWNVSVPKLKASIENNTIKICSTLLGHQSNVIINELTDNLFKHLVPDSKILQFGEIIEGMDGVPDTPLYAQLGVGSDGSPDERRELIDSIRHQLGYPTVEVELTKQQFDYCIDSSIEELRARTSAGYKRGFFFLDLKPNQQRYLLTNSGNGFNKIVSITGIYRTTSSFLRGFDNGVFGQTAINFLYSAQGYDLVSYHLYSSYIEELENLFATKILFQWNERTRALDILQAMYRHERVLLDVSVERTEQDLISDRYLKSWIENWAMAQAMILLSQIRGKYGSLPGANGISLNAVDLYAHAQDIITRLLLDLEDYVIDTPEEFGMGSGIILG